MQQRGEYPVWQQFYSDRREFRLEKSADHHDRCWTPRMNGVEHGLRDEFRSRRSGHIALLRFPSGLAGGADFLGRMMETGIDVGRLNFDDTDAGPREFNPQ